MNLITLSRDLEEGRVGRLLLQNMMIMLILLYTQTVLLPLIDIIIEHNKIVKR